MKSSRLNCAAVGRFVHARLVASRLIHEALLGVVQVEMA